MDFVNSYCQFIQDLNKIKVLFILKLKITWSFDKPTSSRYDGNKLISSRNNSSKLASRKNDNNNKIRFGSNNIENIKKLTKSKSKKISKS